MDWFPIDTDDLTLTTPTPALGLLGTLSAGGIIGADNGDETDESDDTQPDYST